MLIVARNAVEAVKMEDVVDTLHKVIACGENLKKHYIRNSAATIFANNFWK